MEHKLKISKANFVMDEAIETLRKKGTAKEVIQSLKNCVERVEYVRYAPGADSQTARKELLDVAGNVINEIERTFGRRK